MAACRSTVAALTAKDNREEAMIRTQSAAASRPETDSRWIYLGGLSALLLAASYVSIIALYARVGPPPAGAAPWLAYLEGKRAIWWGILGVSVFTDLLFIPTTLALHLVLQSVDRNAMRIASACVALFIVVNLTVTWPAYASLLVISADTTSTPDARLAAATYAAAVLASPLELLYAMGVLSVAILIVGLVMRHGPLGKPIAFFAVATGVLGLVSCIGLGVAIIGASVMTTMWLFWVGAGLCWFAQRRAV